jgi:hypothetical protein
MNEILAAKAADPQQVPSGMMGSLPTPVAPPLDTSQQYAASPYRGGMMNSSPYTSMTGSSQVQNAQRAAAGVFRPPTDAQRQAWLGQQHGALVNGSQLQNDQSHMQWTGSDPTSGVAPGDQGPRPTETQGPAFDPNNPDNAALAGYMAR